LDNLCYQYKYDGRNRLVEKKLPGKGWEFMVYDKSDRLILTQDANLNTQNKWLITKYDQFGRVAYTGFLTGGNRSGRQAEINNLVITESRSTTGFTRNGIMVYYTDGYFVNEIPTILSVSYYDSYPNYGFNPTFPSNVLGQSLLTDVADSQGLSTKSLPVMSLVKNIEDDNWTKDYTYYDKKGRSVGGYSINHLGGYTKTESLLDFAGVAQRTNTYHLRKVGELGITLSEGFIYDSQNRLLQHYHKVDDKPEVILTDNTYNELSQLTNKKVGNNLQSIDYAYNIRGWLTGINKNQMSVPNLDGKLFSYRIKYNEKEGIDNPDPSQFAGKNVVPKYNGNIAEVDWRAIETLGTNPSLTPKRYGYVYDGLNRLTAGYYQNPNNPFSMENIESLSYDLNGNISGLYRTSVINSGTMTPTIIDNLQYVYAAAGNSNKLTNITDSTTNYTGYEGGGQEIHYDLNGNMTDMPDKGIGAINYNYLNLANHLEYSKLPNESVVLDAKYLANGEKIRKTNATTVVGITGYVTTTQITDYLDGFQYLGSPQNTGGGGDPEMRMSLNLESERGMELEAFSLDNGGVASKTILGAKTADLKFFPTAEGFYDYVKDQYIYQYQDHLGNVRVSFGRNTQTQALEIVDANDYYPFGMNHLKSGTSFFGTSSYKNYKYNGKELQETGMYDYGARMYMSDIGRWGTIDPLAEKYRRHSTYNYAVNNPIRFIDPDGMQIMDPGDRFKTIKDAAKDFAMLYNDNSIKDKKEYGTVIYQVTDKKGEKYFTYTTPNISGEEDGVIPAPNFSMDNAKIVSAAHTHSNYDKKYLNDIPSPADKKGAERIGMDAYISTPKGELIKYDYKTNSTFLMDMNIPSDKNHPSRSNKIDSDKLPKNEPTRGTSRIILDNIFIPLLKASPLPKAKGII
jgi:RHS repeat-associated protein